MAESEVPITIERNVRDIGIKRCVENIVTKRLNVMVKDKREKMLNTKKFFSLKCRIWIIVFTLLIANFILFKSLVLFSQDARNLLINIQRQVDIYTEGIQRPDVIDVENIRHANVVIQNRSDVGKGSGTHIKIYNQSYILTCYHILDKPKDSMWAVVNNGDEYRLKLIKHNAKWDLALFKMKNIGLPFLEISTENLKEGDNVVTIGNPGIMEDVITKGNIAKVKGGEYIFTNKTFHGSSGGALLYKGKIAGVVIRMIAYYEIDEKINKLITVNYGIAVGTKRIREFLEGIE